MTATKRNIGGRRDGEAALNRPGFCQILAAYRAGAPSRQAHAQSAQISRVPADPVKSPGSSRLQ